MSEADDMLAALVERESQKPDPTVDELHEENQSLWEMLGRFRTSLRKTRRKVSDLEHEISILKGEPPQCAEKRLAEFFVSMIDYGS